MQDIARQESAGSEMSHFRPGAAVIWRNVADVRNVSEKSRRGAQRPADEEFAYINRFCRHCRLTQVSKLSIITSLRFL